MRPPLILPRGNYLRRGFLAAAMAGKAPPVRPRKSHEYTGGFQGPAPRPSFEIALAMMRRAGKNI